MITIVLILAQIFLLFWVFARMGAYSKVGLAILQVFSVFTIIYILNSKENPAFKLAWIIPLCAVPVLGTLLFLFVQANPGSFRLKHKLKRRIDETEPYTHTQEPIRQAVKADEGDIDEICHYIEHFNHLPAYGNTKVTYFEVGEEKFKDLMVELEKAEHFIFLEYFIIAKGYMWEHVLDLLKRKAEEGVEVRVMYDGTCTLVNLPYDYAGKLAKYGIKAKAFSPIKPLLSTHQNNRDHRKIFVIDGKVAYTGGINLADEYINEIELHGHWKDAAVKLTGDAVRSFTLMFLQMWNISERGEETYACYLPELPEQEPEKELGFVIPYNDGPTNMEDVAERVYLDILNQAKEYVHIMTPYLIPDNEMVVALCFAAQRGIDVKLMLPHIPDKRLIFYIARTYYIQLMQAGVKIYEYTPGFVHSKVFVSDNRKAVVGSINLDFRSLYEHFECAAYIYKNPVIYAIEKDYQRTLSKCQRITPESYKKISLITRGLGHIFRVFGPLV
ncbi:MAG: cardiolipin synthase [Lachnospiraceae bacterium]|nr:cardiolipin synthase [Lachnospiraceae bacterium]